MWNHKVRLHSTGEALEKSEHPSDMAETHTLTIMLLFFSVVNSKGKLMHVCREMCDCWTKMCYLLVLLSSFSVPTNSFPSEIIHSFLLYTSTFTVCFDTKKAEIPCTLTSSISFVLPVVYIFLSVCIKTTERTKASKAAPPCSTCRKRDFI